MIVDLYKEVEHREDKRQGGLSYVLVLGREIQNLGRDGLIPESRYKRILECVADSYPATLAEKVRIVIPAGKLYGNPVSHGAVAKSYLMKRGLPSKMIIAVEDMLPIGRRPLPARTTYEELKNLTLLKDEKVTVICEILQWPRAYLMSWAFGGFRCDWTMTIGWTSWKDILVQFVLTVYTLFDPHQILVHLLLVKFMREKLKANPF